jgi:hypothetical protein
MREPSPWPSMRLTAVTIATVQIALAVAWGLGVTSAGLLAVGTFIGAVLVGMRSLAPSLAPPVILPVHLERRGWHAFEQELARARRYERPLALIRAPLPEAGMTPEPDVMTNINRSLRTVDTAWVDGKALWILATEADRQVASEVIERVIGVAPGIDRDAIRVASFPADALTAGALISGLQSDRAEPIHLPVRTQLDASDAMAIAAKSAASGPRGEGHA